VRGGCQADDHQASTWIPESRNGLPPVGPVPVGAPPPARYLLTMRHETRALRTTRNAAHERRQGSDHAASTRAQSRCSRDVSAGVNSFVFHE
jgi:hypothetical protein